jgi:tripartite-type tricarboxylate transporter receptor subunit TctC
VASGCSWNIIHKPDDETRQNEENPVLDEEGEMKMFQTTVAKGVVLSVALLFLPFTVGVWAADDFPSKPIQIIVGNEPGGSDDLRYRSLAPKMSEVLKQSVVIVNRPGAANQVATTLIAKSKPDGYTIGPSSASALLFTPHMRKVDYNTLTDFTYIAAIATQGLGIVVRKDAPWKTMQELIDYSRKNLGKVKYGSWGIGGRGHLYMETMSNKLNLQWEHVPFKGDAPNITALLGGHVPVSIVTAAFSPYVESGQLRLLAVVAEERMKAFSEVPTLKELGLYIEGIGWNYIGVCGPKGLSPEVIKKLENAVKQATEGDEFRNAMKVLKTDATFIDSQTFTKMLKDAYPRIGEIVNKAGLAKAQ